MLSGPLRLWSLVNMDFFTVSFNHVLNRIAIETNQCTSSVFVHLLSQSSLKGFGSLMTPECTTNRGCINWSHLNTPRHDTILSNSFIDPCHNEFLPSLLH